jgi:hypothetical protein
MHACFESREALYLVNHGIDEAAQGVQRLKKSPKLSMETYHKSMAGLERRRSIINLQFILECANWKPSRNNGFVRIVATPVRPCMVAA